MEPLAVEADDARRFLAAMLQGVQAERGDRGGARVTENAEDAAFLAQAVAFEIEILGRRAGALRRDRAALTLNAIRPGFAAFHRHSGLVRRRHHGRRSG